MAICRANHGSYYQHIVPREHGNVFFQYLLPVPAVSSPLWFAAWFSFLYNEQSQAMHHDKNYGFFSTHYPPILNHIITSAW
jgi:hypothetical protein